MNTLARFAITLLVFLGLGGCQDENRPRIEAVTTASAASPESGKTTGNLPRIALVMKGPSSFRVEHNTHNAHRAGLIRRMSPWALP